MPRRTYTLTGYLKGADSRPMVHVIYHICRDVAKVKVGCDNFPQSGKNAVFSLLIEIKKKNRDREADKAQAAFSTPHSPIVGIGWVPN